MPVLQKPCSVNAGFGYFTSPWVKDTMLALKLKGKWDCSQVELAIKR